MTAHAQVAQPQDKKVLVVPPQAATASLPELEQIQNGVLTAPTTVSAQTAQTETPAVQPVTKTKAASPTKMTLIKSKAEAKPDCQYFAQLGAFGSEDSAWARLASAGVLQNEISSKIVEQRGALIQSAAKNGAMLHRLRMRPMTRSEAQSVCEAANGDCLLVRG